MYKDIQDSVNAKRARLYERFKEIILQEAILKSYNEISREIGIHPATLKSFIQQDRLPAFKVIRKMLIYVIKKDLGEEIGYEDYKNVLDIN